MSKIDGTIKNAHRDGNVVVGTIYGDRKKRFPDGTKIHTSRVMEELPDSIIRTRNSVYKIEWTNTPTEIEKWNEFKSNETIALECVSNRDALIIKSILGSLELYGISEQVKRIESALNAKDIIIAELKAKIKELS